MKAQLQQNQFHFNGQGWHGDIEKYKETQSHRDNARSFERIRNSFWRPAQESTRWLSLVKYTNRLIEKLESIKSRFLSESFMDAPSKR